MFGEHHRLAEEFPEYAEKIHELKMNDSHFAKTYEAYQELDNEIYRFEEGIETTSDEYLEKLKMQRVKLKDELFDMLKK